MHQFIRMHSVTHPPIHTSVNPSTHTSINPSTHTSINPPTDASINPSLPPSTRPPTSLHRQMPQRYLLFDQKQGTRLIMGYWHFSNCLSAQMLQQNHKYNSVCQRETTFERFPEKLIWKGKWRLDYKFWMNFRKTSKGGGGVISNPKNCAADFSVLNEHFSLLNFWEKGGVTPNRCRFWYFPKIC